ncbi:chromatin target of PRMT1 protein-like [Ostrinia furnacalis]|uniref:chromatin target of PRMT1 protein-like n=1 Tax=Ostrinia furnacalis TaxID=93504 RepID=UPI00103994D0|nr:chromatin target of PRMT1 protein-like [Ostrinia furnacalis]
MMVIEKVHGLQATSLSLNERFTLLAAAAPDRVVSRPRRRPSVNSYFNENNMNLRNQNFLGSVAARRLEFEAKRQALRQRLGTLRRFGSESSLPGLRRYNSYSNLSQGSFKQRPSWRQNGNLSRSTSFENLSQAWRGYRRRRGVWRARGRFRGRGGFTRDVPRFAGAGGVGTRGRTQRARGGVTRARGRGRAGILKNQTQKPVPTREELDEQLDQYMACSRAALDHELDEYMKNAMELE